MSRSRTAPQRKGGRQAGRRRTRRNTRTVIGIVVGGIVVVGLVALLIVRQITPAVPGEERIANQGAGHTANVTDPHTPYNSNPPTSGIHIGGGTAPWGVTGQPLPDEQTVHNLEHGGVIFHYRQGLDQATIDQLTTLARDLQRQNPCILLQPRAADKIGAPIAATAWNYLLELQSFDADALTKFFQAHVGRGPEAVCRR